MFALFGWTILLIALIGLTVATGVLMIVSRGLTGDAGWKIGAPILCACAYGLYLITQSAPFTVTIQ